MSDDVNDRRTEQTRYLDQGWSGAGLDWYDPSPVRYKSTKKLSSLVDNSVSVGKYQPVPRVQTFMKWMNGVGGVSNVKFDTPSRKQILKSFENCFNLKSWVIPEVEDKVLYLHVERLRHTLLWWEENRFRPGRRAIMDPEEIMYRNLKEGPAFAEYLSDVWKYRYRHHLGEWTIDEPPHLEFLGDLPSYSYVFPSRHLIPFEMEDPEDWKLGLEYLPQDPTFDVLGFKEHVKENLKKGITLPTVDDFDIADFAGNTKTWTSLSGRNLTRSEYLAKRCPELTDKFEFKYSPVQKSADEFRCSVIASPDTLFTINACMRQLNAINKNKIDCMHIQDTSWLPTWCSGDYTFLMLDQRKCGITFSKDLMREVCEAILEVYPQSYFGYIIKGLENHSLYVDGIEYHPKRGLGLGMANELVSFAMACLMSYFFELRRDDAYQGLVFNDDQIIRVSVEEGDEAWNRSYSHFKKWKKFMTKAGCEVHPSKSYYSTKAGVFLEEYGSHIGTTVVDKDVSYAMSVFYAIMAPNIAAAKAYVSDLSNLEMSTTDKFTSAIEYVISLVGYEFTPSEVAYPYPIGWVNQRELGMNMLFYHLLEEGDYTDAFWNVLSVGGIPSIGSKTLAEGFGGYAGPFSQPILGPASRGNWLRKLKHWAQKRQDAFKSRKEPFISKILWDYVGHYPDKYWLTNEIPPEPEVPVRMTKRELYLLGQTINPTGEARVDESRAVGNLFIRFLTTDQLSYFVARSAEVGTEVAYHDTVMGGWRETTYPHLPYDSILSVGDYHVFVNCTEIDNEHRKPTRFHVSDAVWYLAVKLGRDMLGDPVYRDYLIEALDDLEQKAAEELVHPEEEDTGGTGMELKDYLKSLDPNMVLNTLQQLLGARTVGEELITRGRVDADSLEEQRRSFISRTLAEGYAIDANAFFGTGPNNNSSDGEPLGFDDMEDWA